MAIAFFSTWTAYGTWLPGDIRGWFERGNGFRQPDMQLNFAASLILKDVAIELDREQRALVEKTIAEHCVIRKWVLHAVNCRSNHVHVVVTAPGREIEEPREQFKAWCTRKLKERQRLVEPGRKLRNLWWTERGWDEYIDGEEALERAIAYVLEGQGPS